MIIQFSEYLILKQIPHKLLEVYRPREEWLSHPSYIHGTGHLTRVFILQEFLCDQLEKTGVEVDRDATRWAAAVHDVGRVDDGIDLLHGKRSAEWMRVHLADKLSPESFDRATYAVHWHVPSDEEAPVMTAELRVLKDADGLDRVRLGDLNPTYLRTVGAHELISTAKSLYETSVKLGGDELNSYESVLAAAKRIGLIRSETDC